MASFKRQVSLLLMALPEVAKESSFALHGGTAINLFVRDMPRLSVDIDLTYVPIEDRKTSYKNISRALARIKVNIEARRTIYVKWRSNMKELINLIKSSNNIVFFGGAGTSTESDIPDFRSPNGLYSSDFADYKPEDILSNNFFNSNTRIF